jgi:uroporphyrinogen-III synthase
LAKWVAQRGWTLSGQSLLRFAAVDFVLPEGQFDWIFFYSPRAVAFFFEQQAEMTLATKLATIGPGTAVALEQAGCSADFIGNGEPHKVAQDFLEVAGGKSVLFPRARRSRRSIEQLLATEIKATDVIVYDNYAVPPPQPITADVVMLTSPLNVRAWFTTHSAEAVGDQYFLALGKSTAAAYKAYGIEADFPPEPTEAATITLLEKLFK